MNFRKRQGALPQFQMTAMMDVVFLLLCFFVTSTVFSQWENEVNITLPTAKSGELPTRSPGEIILNVGKNGSVTVNQRTLAGAELENLLHRIATDLPGQPIIIRMDKAGNYGDFMSVVDACRTAGISSFALATADDAPADVPLEPPPLD